MRKVMLSIIVMLAVLAGIPATACWYLDPANPAMTAFDNPPERIAPPISSSETVFDPETGTTTTTITYDEGDYKFTRIYTHNVDPETGVETTSYSWVFETYTPEGGMETRTLDETYVFDPATGNTTKNTTEQTSRYNQLKLADGSVVWTTTSGQKTNSETVVEGVRWVDISNGAVPADRSVGWENVETTKQTVTETIVPVLDPETGSPVLDPETGVPMTESVYSDPITETTTTETGQTITLDPENGIIDSTNTTTTVIVINPSTGTSETTTTTEETTTTTDPETGSTETTTETETQNPDGTIVTESSTKNETVTYDEDDAPVVNWWENRTVTEPYDVVRTTVTTSVDPVTGVTTITTTTITEHWDGYGWDTTTETETETIPPAPLLTKINHVPVRYVADPTEPTARVTQKTDAPMNIYVRLRYYGDYTLHCFESPKMMDEDRNPAWSYSWTPARKTLLRVNGKYHSPPLMLFGRGLYPDMNQERNNIFWPGHEEFILSISTSADPLKAWHEMWNCCGGVNCKYGRHVRIKLSNITKPGK